MISPAPSRVPLVWRWRRRQRRRGCIRAQRQRNRLLQLVGDRRHFDVKRFNDIRTFSGGEEERSEWSFVFSVAVNAQSHNAKNLMTQMADTSEGEELNVQE